MKKLAHFLSLCVLAAVLLAASGCVQDQPRRYVRRGVPHSPYIGSPEWITWVDHKVDTRYSNGIRPDPGTQEWYAIVDHVVFADYSHDYYRSVYRDEYRNDYRRNNPARDGYYNRGNYYGRDNFNNRGSYYGPARFGSRDGYSRDGYYGDNRRSLRLGSLEWKRAVDAEILSGRVPPPPPRSDPWDAPLAPTH